MFCNKMRSRIKSVLQQWDEYIDSNAEAALKVTTVIKRILESPVTDILTAVIPGEADDLLRKRLIMALDYAITALQARDNCATCEDVSSKLQCMVEQLKQLPEDKKDALLQKLASLMTYSMDGRRLKQNLYDLYVQAKYVLNKQQQ